VKPGEQATIGDLLPAFSLELQTLTRAAGRPDLAGQIPSLPIVARCTCGQDNCAQFYTEAPPRGAYPAGHSNLMLPDPVGLIVLDIVGDRIVCVEILDRPDVKPAIDKILPLT
jgi:hypothetical protein